MGDEVDILSAFSKALVLIQWKHIRSVTADLGLALSCWNFSVKNGCSILPNLEMWHAFRFGPFGELLILDGSLIVLPFYQIEVETQALE